MEYANTTSDESKSTFERRRTGILLMGASDAEHAPLSADGGAVAPRPSATRARWAVSVLLVTVAVQLSGIPAAQASWAPPERLSSAPPVESAAHAANANGDGLALWSEGDERAGAVVGRVRGPSGAWGPPDEVGARGSLAYSVAGGVDAAGNSFAVWATSGSSSGISAAVRPAALGRWLMPRQISHDPSRRPARGTPLAIAVSPAGEAIVAWLSTETADGVGPARVTASTFAPVAGEWSAPQDLAQGADPDVGLAVSINEQGTQTVSWTAESGQTAVAVRVTGAWRAPAPLPGGVTWAPVVIGPENGLVAIGHAPRPGGGRRIVAAESGADARFEPIRNVAASGQATDASVLPVAFDSEGNATAAWSWTVGSDGAPSRVLSAVRGPGGLWGRPALVAGGAQGGRLASAGVSTEGDAVGVWSESRGGANTIRAASRSRGSRAWQPPDEIPSAGLTGRLGVFSDVDVRGRASVVIWRPDRELLATRRRSGGQLRLTALQLIINQRIAQSAVRRANGVQALLDAGLDGSRVRRGALSRADFDSSVTVSGEPTDALVTAGMVGTVPLSPASSNPGDVRLTARQLLINQRIAQAALLRVRALRARLDRGLTGGDFRDGTISREALAPGVSVESTSTAPSPGPSRTTVEPRSISGGTIRVSRQQLAINQRIAQAAVREINPIVRLFETGIDGSAIRDGGLVGRDLSG